MNSRVTVDQEDNISFLSANNGHFMPAGGSNEPANEPAVSISMDDLFGVVPHIKATASSPFNFASRHHGFACEMADDTRRLL